MAWHDRARHPPDPRYCGHLGAARLALLAGSVLGILAFRSVNELTFRRILLTILLLSGVLLVV